MSEKKLKAIDYHRNGCCGEPFHVAIVKDDGRDLLIVHFDGLGEHTGLNTITAVFDLDLLAERDIEFGSNSFRGDHYSGFMRDAIAKHRAEQDAEHKAWMASRNA